MTSNTAEAWPIGRYRLTAKAYIRPRPGADVALLEPGAEILWAGRPGWHMEPMDEAAEANVGRAILANNGAPLTGNPVEQLPLAVGELAAAAAGQGR